MRAFSRVCCTISLSVNSRAVSLIRRCSSVKSKSITLLSLKLWRCPRRRQTTLDLLGDALDRHALLCQRVAVAQRHRAILDRLVVDRQAERRPDLVLAPVALADRAALVVLRLHPRAQQ